MKIYIISISVGLIVGILYDVLNVRPPAPPVNALVGLLGILVGEQIPPLRRHVYASSTLGAIWHTQIKPHVFGNLASGDGKKEEKPRA